VSKIVSPRCLDCVRGDGLAFGAIDGELELLAASHGTSHLRLCLMPVVRRRR
jgi:hypothetical protein